MSRSLERREFLKVAGLASASSLGLGLEGHARPQDPPAGKKVRLFSGCCAYSYEKYLQGGRMTMEDFILKAVDLEIDGVDMTTYYLKSTDPDYLVSLRHLAFKNAVPFSGAAIGSDMCQPDPAKRAAELEKIKRWVDVTDLLGASHLRVFGGAIPKGASEEQAVGWVVETMKPACDYAAKKGITLGIESHGGITEKASNILKIIRGVDSPYAGINLDVTNFLTDYYDQIEACAPYATHTHFRERFGNSKEPVDFDRVWQIFVRAGYKGFMSAEYEGEEDAMTGVPKLVAKIKEYNKKYSNV